MTNVSQPMNKSVFHPSQSSLVATQDPGWIDNLAGFGGILNIESIWVAGVSRCLSRLRYMRTGFYSHQKMAVIIYEICVENSVGLELLYYIPDMEMENQLKCGQKTQSETNGACRILGHASSHMEIEAATREH